MAWTEHNYSVPLFLPFEKGISSTATYHNSQKKKKEEKWVRTGVTRPFLAVEPLRALAGN
ncbi:hypothetical protein EMPG_12827 [Blastomyces silverae]|uniref:Uncharacterized protein n=1 Tax=Blastomyces silverae TaxID=2060906 RepID=A0A0H1BL73_9EURO|nr:hypothetical protein EMPG_12827 [Blastomyces silverae]